jgi:septal ring factor EnvC (AmiA/AmiB activator)
MRKLLTISFLICSCVLLAQPAQQQKLEERKAQIQKEIQENQRLLKSVQSKEKSATTELIIKREKIKLKEKLINTTERQTKALNNDMYLNQLQINRLSRELEDLKADYSEMILKSYKSRSEQSRAMFLLSSESFLQAYKRAQYMKQYASYRRSQGEEIEKKSVELQEYNKKLEVQKKEKERLLAENQRERADLEQERKEQEELVKKIQKDKKQIAAEIKTKQAESKKIDAQIKKLIADAIAAANKKNAAAAAKSGAPKTSSTASSSAAPKIVLTPEGKVISDNFKANKGRLPWPVVRGVVTLGYGDQPHPVHKSLVVHNSGVEITTDAGSQARAVFGGEVAAVIVISPVNKAVMIQHGDYFTVYQNLSNVSVTKGDKVSINQNLGTIRTNDAGKTVIKFTISQNTTYVNPQSWLAGM